MMGERSNLLIKQPKRFQTLAFVAFSTMNHFCYDNIEKMMNQSDKSYRLEVFRSFMNIQGLEGEASLQESPAPTIRFKNASGEQRSFEIVEVSDPNFINGQSYIRYDSQPLNPLRDSWAKEYKSEVEIDLILYYDQCEPPQGNTWVNQLKESINSLKKNVDKFTNVFVFNLKDRSVDFDFNNEKDAA